MSTLTLEDKEIHFDDDDEFSRNDYLLKCIIDDFLNISPQGKYPYLNVDDGENVLFIYLFVLKAFSFLIVW